MKKIILMAVMIVALGSCEKVLNQTAIEICQGVAHLNYDSRIEDATTDEEIVKLESQLDSALRRCEYQIGN